MAFGWITCTGMLSLRTPIQFSRRHAFVSIASPVFNLLQASKSRKEAYQKKAEWILQNHDNTWRNWRCTVIAGWVRDFKTVLKEEAPGALLGVYHCPWDDDDFNGARRRNLGLDYDMLKGIVDVFSPMVYHERMGRSPEWVRENIQWFSKRLNIKDSRFPKVWPIVQAHNDPGTISAEEFEKVLRYGAGAGSTGVMMFTSNSVAEDPMKIETMKAVYTGWKNRK